MPEPLTRVKRRKKLSEKTFHKAQYCELCGRELNSFEFPHTFDIRTGVEQIHLAKQCPKGCIQYNFYIEGEQQ